MNRFGMFVVFGSFILFVVSFVSAVYPQQDDTCQQLYWFDDDNRDCLKREFCGMYIYSGLQTFDTKRECQNALNNDERVVCTQEAKQCDNGSYVSRNSSDNCKFDRCPVGGNEGDNSCTLGSDCVRDRCQKNKCVNVNNVLKTFAACNVSENAGPDACRCSDDNKCVGLKNLSNGKRQVEIKTMPWQASERAIERLGDLGFNVSLRQEQVGRGGGTIKTFYLAEGEKEGKMLGLFKIRARMNAEVDAETGEVVRVHKPWWSFIASGI